MPPNVTISDRGDAAQRPSWLAGDWERGAESRREAAVASDDGLMRVRGALGQKALTLEEERRKAAVAERFRFRL